MVGCGGSSSDDNGGGGGGGSNNTTQTNITKSSNKNLTSFTFANGVIKDYVVIGTDVNITIDYHSKDLTPIVTHTGVSYSPNGTAINFAPIPATYTITAEDNTTKDYKVIVRRAFEVSDEEELADAIDEITNAIAFDSSSLSYITILVKNDIVLPTSKTIFANWANRNIVFENYSNSTLVTIKNLARNGVDIVERIGGVNIDPPADCVSSTTDICTADQFNNIRNGLAGTYKLLADIDLSSYPDWTPIGNYNTRFTGKLDGNGHTISGLKFKNTDNDAQYTGLFGYISGSSAEIKNLKVQVANSADTINLTQDGSQYFGVIVGHADNGVNLAKTVVSSSVPLTIRKSGTDSLFVGGVVGLANGISTSKSASSITFGVTNVAASYSSAVAYVGGIAGRNYNAATISNSYSTGNISANGNYEAYAGGIAGNNGQGAVISRSYASGAILANDSSVAYAGGIAGQTDTGISNSATLNPSVVASGSTVYSNRIAHNFVISSHTNNFALSSTIVNGNIISSNNPNGDDGLDKEDYVLKIQSIWEGDLGWDFTTIWKWDIVKNRPVLQR
jgi:hypothetical protein